MIGAGISNVKATWTKVLAPDATGAGKALVFLAVIAELMRKKLTRSATGENVQDNCFHESGNSSEQDTAGIY